MTANLKSHSRLVRFADLQKAVGYCDLCPRLAHRAKILSDERGNIYSRVMFVAEAPGRFGADRTGIPLFGDATGERFERLLGAIGWHRHDVFVTNTVLCNPRDSSGSNSPPTATELRNCLPYLRMQISLVDPQVVVALGRVALEAMRLIDHHDLTLREASGVTHTWGGRLLFPMYHPGPRAQVHRPFPRQQGDFLRLAKLVHPLTGLKPSRPTAASRAHREPAEAVQLSPMAMVVLAVVLKLQRLSYFRLTKLLYLADLVALTRLGRTITREIYLRQPEGPWPPALPKTIQCLSNHEITVSFEHRRPIVRGGPAPRFAPDLLAAEAEVVTDVLLSYGNLSDAAIKSVVYKSVPMKYLLYQEALGRDVRRVPVLYRDKTAPQLDPVAGPPITLFE